jgi:hypothetical protein
VYQSQLSIFAEGWKPRGITACLQKLVVADGAVLNFSTMKNLHVAIQVHALCSLVMNGGHKSYLLW